MKYSLAVALLIGLTGCATVAIPTEQSTPTSRVLDKSLTVERASNGRLIIKRDPGFIGGACAIRVSINGKPLAELNPGEVVTAFLDPGEYIVRASSTSLCGGGDSEAQLLLRQGEIRTYRISVDQGGTIRVGPTAQ